MVGTATWENVDEIFGAHAQAIIKRKIKIIIAAGIIPCCSPRKCLPPPQKVLQGPAD